MRGEPRQGKCVNCKVGFRWNGAPLVRDAHCPSCGNPLKRTSYLLQYQWRLERPLGAARERAKA